MNNSEKMGEETRKVLNKSIDLLHKLSKEKITAKQARQELSTILAGHFLASNQDSKGIDINQKVRLKRYLDEALSIVDQISTKQAPLYEGILLMNKVILKRQSEEVVPLNETTLSPYFEESRFDEVQEPALMSDQFDLSGTQKEEGMKREVINMVEGKSTSPNYTEMGIQELMQEVLKNKDLLEKSIAHLNTSLLRAGFELKTVHAK